MNIYRYTLNRDSHSQYKYLKTIDFDKRKDNINYSNFRLLSDVSRKYLGTSTEKIVDFDFSQLLSADLIILVGATYVGDNVEENMYLDVLPEPRYKPYEDMIIPTSVFGDSFLIAGTFLNIPVLFVGTKDVNKIENYGKYLSKFPYFIISYHDSIMGVLNEITLKKDAKVFIIATDKHQHDIKHTNTVLKKVEKELKCYGCSVN